MNTIGKKIWEVRKSKGLTQEELSNLAKINLRTLQRIEKDETEPQSNTIKKICEVLDLPIEDILDYGKQEDNTYLIYFHLSVLSFFIIPLGNIMLPTIMWLSKRDKISGLNELGADLLNFQISWTILVFVSLMFSIFVYFDWHSTSGRVYVPAAVIVFILIIINIIYSIT